GLLREILALEPNLQLTAGPRAEREEPNRLVHRFAHLIERFELGEVSFGQNLPDSEAALRDNDAWQAQTELPVDKQTHPLGISHLVPNLGYPSGVARCLFHDNEYASI